MSEILKFPWQPSRAYSSLKSSEMVYSMPRGDVILDTGHYLMSHPRRERERERERERAQARRQEFPEGGSR